MCEGFGCADFAPVNALVPRVYKGIQVDLRLTSIVKIQYSMSLGGDSSEAAFISSVLVMIMES